MYENLYGMSCLENQVLAVLKKRAEKISYLYHDSAISARVLYDLLVCQGQQPEHFTGVARIQDVLKDLGVIELTLQKQPMSLLERAYESCGENQYILPAIKLAFTREKLSARGLRSDHYALLTKINGSFYLYNDIPEIRVPVHFSRDDFYNGMYFTLTFRRNLTKEDIRWLNNNRCFLPDCAPAYCPQVPAQKFSDFSKRLCQFTGVLKTMRYRLRAYYQNYCDTRFLDGYPEMLEKQYALLAYLSFRKIDDCQRYQSILNQIMEMDAAHMRTLALRLGE